MGKIDENKKYFFFVWNVEILALFLLRLHKKVNEIFDPEIKKCKQAIEQFW